MELRRFRIKHENAKVFFAWCDKKGLSRNDLIYILDSIEFNTEAFPKQNTSGAIRQEYPPTDQERGLIEYYAKRLAELPEVESGQAGLYQKFDVKRKYSNDRSEITDAAVIVIPHLVL